jgi:transposase
VVLFDGAVASVGGLSGRFKTIPGWVSGSSRVIASGRYRVIAAQSKPDHATIARFVERHQDALAELFGAVLGLWAKAGLVGLDVVAVDGSKVPATASRSANRDYERR